MLPKGALQLGALQLRADSLLQLGAGLATILSGHGLITRPSWAWRSALRRRTARPRG